MAEYQTLPDPTTPPSPQAIGTTMRRPPRCGRSSRPIAGRARPPFRNKPVRLLDWQRLYINALFGWVDADGPQALPGVRLMDTEEKREEYPMLRPVPLLPARAAGK